MSALHDDSSQIQSSDHFHHHTTARPKTSSTPRENIASAKGISINPHPTSVHHFDYESSHPAHLPLPQTKSSVGSNPRSSPPIHANHSFHHHPHLHDGVPPLYASSIQEGIEVHDVEPDITPESDESIPTASQYPPRGGVALKRPRAHSTEFIYRLTSSLQRRSIVYLRRTRQLSTFKAWMGLLTCQTFTRWCLRTCRKSYRRPFKNFVYNPGKQYLEGKRQIHPVLLSHLAKTFATSRPNSSAPPISGAQQQHSPLQYSPHMGQPTGQSVTQQKKRTSAFASDVHLNPTGAGIKVKSDQRKGRMTPSRQTRRRGLPPLGNQSSLSPRHQLRHNKHPTTPSQQSMQHDGSYQSSTTMHSPFGERSSYYNQIPTIKDDESISESYRESNLYPTIQPRQEATMSYNDQIHIGLIARQIRLAASIKSKRDLHQASYMIRERGAYGMNDLQNNGNHDMSGFVTQTSVLTDALHMNPETAVLSAQLTQDQSATGRQRYDIETQYMNTITHPTNLNLLLDEYRDPETLAEVLVDYPSIDTFELDAIPSTAWQLRPDRGFGVWCYGTDGYGFYSVLSEEDAKFEILSSYLIEPAFILFPCLCRRGSLLHLEFLIRRMHHGILGEYIVPILVIVSLLFSQICYTSGVFVLYSIALFFNTVLAILLVSELIMALLTVKQSRYYWYTFPFDLIVLASVLIDLPYLGVLVMNCDVQYERFFVQSDIPRFAEISKCMHEYLLYADIMRGFRLLRLHRLARPLIFFYEQTIAKRDPAVASSDIEEDMIEIRDDIITSSLEAAEQAETGSSQSGDPSSMEYGKHDGRPLSASSSSLRANIVETAANTLLGPSFAREIVSLSGMPPELQSDAEISSLVHSYNMESHVQRMGMISSPGITPDGTTNMPTYWNTFKRDVNPMKFQQQQYYNSVSLQRQQQLARQAAGLGPNTMGIFPPMDGIPSVEQQGLGYSPMHREPVSPPGLYASQKQVPIYVASRRGGPVTPPIDGGNPTSLAALNTPSPIIGGEIYVGGNHLSYLERKDPLASYSEPLHLRQQFLLAHQFVPLMFPEIYHYFQIPSIEPSGFELPTASPGPMDFHRHDRQGYAKHHQGMASSQYDPAGWELGDGGRNSILHDHYNSMPRASASDIGTISSGESSSRRDTGTYVARDYPIENIRQLQDPIEDISNQLLEEPDDEARLENERRLTPSHPNEHYIFRIIDTTRINQKNRMILPDVDYHLYAESSIAVILRRKARTLNEYLYMKLFQDQLAGELIVKDDLFMTSRYRDSVRKALKNDPTSILHVKEHGELLLKDGYLFEPFLTAFDCRYNSLNLFAGFEKDVCEKIYQFYRSWSHYSFQFRYLDHTKYSTDQLARHCTCGRDKYGTIRRFLYNSNTIEGSLRVVLYNTPCPIHYQTTPSFSGSLLTYPTQVLIAQAQYQVDRYSTILHSIRHDENIMSEPEFIDLIMAPLPTSMPSSSQPTNMMHEGGDAQPAKYDMETGGMKYDGGDVGTGTTVSSTPTTATSGSNLSNAGTIEPYSFKAYAAQNMSLQQYEINGFILYKTDINPSDINRNQIGIDLFTLESIFNLLYPQYYLDSPRFMASLRKKMKKQQKQNSAGQGGSDGAGDNGRITTQHHTPVPLPSRDRTSFIVASPRGRQTYHYPPEVLLSPSLRGRVQHTIVRPLQNGTRSGKRIKITRKGGSTGRNSSSFLFLSKLRRSKGGQQRKQQQQQQQSAEVELTRMNSHGRSTPGRTSEKHMPYALISHHNNNDIRVISPRHPNDDLLRHIDTQGGTDRQPHTTRVPYKNTSDGDLLPTDQTGTGYTGGTFTSQSQWSMHTSGGRADHHKQEHDAASLRTPQHHPGLSPYEGSDHPTPHDHPLFEPTAPSRYSHSFQPFLNSTFIGAPEYQNMYVRPPQPSSSSHSSGSQQHGDMIHVDQIQTFLPPPLPNSKRAQYLDQLSRVVPRSLRYKAAQNRSDGDRPPFATLRLLLGIGITDQELDEIREQQVALHSIRLNEVSYKGTQIGWKLNEQVLRLILIVFSIILCSIPLIQYLTQRDTSLQDTISKFDELVTTNQIYGPAIHMYYDALVLHFNNIHQPMKYLDLFDFPAHNTFTSDLFSPIYGLTAQSQFESPVVSPNRPAAPRIILDNTANLFRLACLDLARHVFILALIICCALATTHIIGSVLLIPVMRMKKSVQDVGHNLSHDRLARDLGLVKGNQETNQLLRKITTGHSQTSGDGGNSGGGTTHITPGMPMATPSGPNIESLLQPIHQSHSGDDNMRHDEGQQQQRQQGRQQEQKGRQHPLYVDWSLLDQEYLSQPVDDVEVITKGTTPLDAQYQILHEGVEPRSSTAAGSGKGTGRSRDKTGANKKSIRKSTIKDRGIPAPKLSDAEIIRREKTPLHHELEDQLDDLPLSLDEQKIILYNLIQAQAPHLSKYHLTTLNNLFSDKNAQVSLDALSRYDDENFIDPSSIEYVELYSGISQMNAGSLEETAVLERTLLKLRELLQIGLGNAGSRLIEASMHSDASISTILRSFRPRRVLAVYSFCDIRRFTDATEQLRDHVMLYVNQIAKIVHTYVIRSMGYPNKNVGDAFFNVWILPREYSSTFGDLLLTHLPIASRIALSSNETADYLIREQLLTFASLAHKTSYARHHEMISIIKAYGIGYFSLVNDHDVIPIDVDLITEQHSYISRVRAHKKEIKQSSGIIKQLSRLKRWDLYQRLHHQQFSSFYSNYKKKPSHRFATYHQYDIDTGGMSMDHQRTGMASPIHGTNAADSPHPAGLQHDYMKSLHHHRRVYPYYYPDKEMDRHSQARQQELSQIYHQLEAHHPYIIEIDPLSDEPKSAVDLAPYSSLARLLWKDLRYNIVKLNRCEDCSQQGILICSHVGALGKAHKETDVPPFGTVSGYHQQQPYGIPPPRNGGLDAPHYSPEVSASATSSSAAVSSHAVIDHRNETTPLGNTALFEEFLLAQGVHTSIPSNTSFRAPGVFDSVLCQCRNIFCSLCNYRAPTNRQHLRNIETIYHELIYLERQHLMRKHAVLMNELIITPHDFSLLLQNIPVLQFETRTPYYSYLAQLQSETYGQPMYGGPSGSTGYYYDPAQNKYYPIEQYGPGGRVHYPQFNHSMHPTDALTSGSHPFSSGVSGSSARRSSSSTRTGYMYSGMDGHAGYDGVGVLPIFNSNQTTAQKQLQHIFEEPTDAGADEPTANLDDFVALAQELNTLEILPFQKSKPDDDEDDEDDDNESDGNNDGDDGDIHPPIVQSSAPPQNAEFIPSTSDPIQSTPRSTPTESTATQISQPSDTPSQYAEDDLLGPLPAHGALKWQEFTPKSVGNMMLTPSSMKKTLQPELNGTPASSSSRFTRQTRDRSQPPSASPLSSSAVQSYILLNNRRRHPSLVAPPPNESLSVLDHPDFSVDRSRYQTLPSSASKSGRPYDPDGDGSMDHFSATGGDHRDASHTHDSRAAQADGMESKLGERSTDGQPHTKDGNEQSTQQQEYEEVMLLHITPDEKAREDLIDTYANYNENYLFSDNHYYEVMIEHDERLFHALTCDDQGNTIFDKDRYNMFYFNNHTYRVEPKQYKNFYEATIAEMQFQKRLCYGELLVHDLIEFKNVQRAFIEAYQRYSHRLKEYYNHVQKNYHELIRCARADPSFVIDLHKEKPPPFSHLETVDGYVFDFLQDTKKDFAQYYYLPRQKHFYDILPIDPELQELQRTLEAQRRIYDSLLSDTAPTGSGSGIGATYHPYDSMGQMTTSGKGLFDMDGTRLYEKEQTPMMTGLLSPQPSTAHLTDHLGAGSDAGHMIGSPRKRNDTRSGSAQHSLYTADREGHNDLRTTGYHTLVQAHSDDTIDMTTDDDQDIVFINNQLQKHRLDIHDPQAQAILKECFHLFQHKYKGLDIPRYLCLMEPLVTATQSIADYSLSAVVKITIEIYKSSILRNIVEMFLAKTLANFTLSLGFGLHVGWSIEGPVGSAHKIDPSYLSTHAYLSETLESMTKQYDVSILMTGEFVSLLSYPLQLLCRKVDRVMFPSKARYLGAPHMNDKSKSEGMQPGQTGGTTSKRASTLQKDGKRRPSQTSSTYLGDHHHEDSLQEFIRNKNYILQLDSNHDGDILIKRIITKLESRRINAIDNGADFTYTPYDEFDYTLLYSQRSNVGLLLYLEYKLNNNIPMGAQELSARHQERLSNAIATDIYTIDLCPQDVIMLAGDYQTLFDEWASLTSLDLEYIYYTLFHSQIEPLYNQLRLSILESLQLNAELQAQDVMLSQHGTTPQDGLPTGDTTTTTTNSMTQGGLLEPSIRHPSKSMGSDITGTTGTTTSKRTDHTLSEHNQTATTTTTSSLFPSAPRGSVPPEHTNDMMSFDTSLIPSSVSILEGVQGHGTLSTASATQQGVSPYITSSYHKSYQPDRGDPHYNHHTLSLAQSHSSPRPGDQSTTLQSLQPHITTAFGGGTTASRSPLSSHRTYGRHHGTDHSDSNLSSYGPSHAGTAKTRTYDGARTSYTGAEKDPRSERYLSHQHSSNYNPQQERNASLPPPGGSNQQYQRHRVYPSPSPHRSELQTEHMDHQLLQYTGDVSSPTHQSTTASSNHQLVADQSRAQDRERSSNLHSHGEGAPSPHSGSHPSATYPGIGNIGRLPNHLYTINATGELIFNFYNPPPPPPIFTGVLNVKVSERTYEVLSRLLLLNPEQLQERINMAMMKYDIGDEIVKYNNFQYIAMITEVFTKDRAFGIGETLKKSLLTIQHHYNAVYSPYSKEDVVHKFLNTIPLVDRTLSSGPYFLSGDPLAAYQASIPFSFRKHAALCVEYYIVGEWKLARDHYRHAQMVYPSKSLNPMYDYMESLNFKAPPDWPGYRVIE